MEFARSGLLVKDTIVIDISTISEGKLFYAFKNKNAFQKGIYELNKVPIPETLALYPAFPNPFNPVTTIIFDVPFSEKGPQKTSLVVYDLTGRVVQSLINEELVPGSHKINWHAEIHASSIYFVHLRYGNLTKTQKVVFLK